MKIAYSLFLAAMMAVLPACVEASSDDAWVQFGKDVSAGCLKAVGNQIKKPAIVVDSNGSENFGIGIVYGVSAFAPRSISCVCLYDKKTKKVDLGGELDINIVKGKIRR